MDKKIQLSLRGWSAFNNPFRYVIILKTIILKDKE